VLVQTFLPVTTPEKILYNQVEILEVLFPKTKIKNFMIKQRRWGKEGEIP